MVLMCNLWQLHARQLHQEARGQEKASCSANVEERERFTTKPLHQIPLSWSGLEEYEKFTASLMHVPDSQEHVSVSEQLVWQWSHTLLRNVLPQILAKEMMLTKLLRIDNNTSKQHLSVIPQVPDLCSAKTEAIGDEILRQSCPGCKKNKMGDVQHSHQEWQQNVSVSAMRGTLPILIKTCCHGFPSQTFCSSRLPNIWVFYKRPAFIHSQNKACRRLQWLIWRSSCEQKQERAAHQSASFCAWRMKVITAVPNHCW